MKKLYYLLLVLYFSLFECPHVCSVLGQTNMREIAKDGWSQCDNCWVQYKVDGKQRCIIKIRNTDYSGTSYIFQLRVKTKESQIIKMGEQINIVFPMGLQDVSKVSYSTRDINPSIIKSTQEKNQISLLFMKDVDIKGDIERDEIEREKIQRPVFITIVFCIKDGALEKTLLGEEIKILINQHTEEPSIFLREIASIEGSGNESSDRSSMQTNVPVPVNLGTLGFRLLLEVNPIDLAAITPKVLPEVSPIGSPAIAVRVFGVIDPIDLAAITPKVLPEVSSIGSPAIAVRVFGVSSPIDLAAITPKVLPEVSPIGSPAIAVRVFGVSSPIDLAAITPKVLPEVSPIGSPAIAVRVFGVSSPIDLAAITPKVLPEVSPIGSPAIAVRVFGVSSPIDLAAITPKVLPEVSPIGSPAIAVRVFGVSSPIDLAAITPKVLPEVSSIGSPAIAVRVFGVIDPIDLAAITPKVLPEVSSIGSPAIAVRVFGVSSPIDLAAITPKVLPEVSSIGSPAIIPKPLDAVNEFGTAPELVVGKFKAEFKSVDVVVTDGKRNAVKWLSEDDFEIIDNGKLKKIETFSTDQKQPILIGFVVDTSSSMLDKLKTTEGNSGLTVIEAAKFITSQAKDKDKFFAVSFNREVFRNQEVTHDVDKINDSLNQMVTNEPLFVGSSLIDALVFSLKDIGGEQACKKALIVLTDGKESGSFYKKDYLEKIINNYGGVRIYIIGFTDILSSKSPVPFKKTEKETIEEFLSNMANVSGGAAVFPKSIKDIENTLIRINDNLRTEYHFTYAVDEDGLEERKNEIKVNIKNRKQKMDATVQNCIGTKK